MSMLVTLYIVEDSYLLKVSNNKGYTSTEQFIIQR